MRMRKVNRFLSVSSYLAGIVALTAFLIINCQYRALGDDVCGGLEFYSKSLMSDLATYDAALQSGSRERADELWKTAKRVSAVLSWGYSTNYSGVSCDDATHAFEHYAQSWYTIDALENGTAQFTELSFEVADTEIGMARAEAFCSGVRFPGPGLDAFQKKLRHYMALAHVDYNSFTSYPQPSGELCGAYCRQLVRM